MNVGNFESVLKESLLEMPPSSSDARIVSVIRATARRRAIWRGLCLPMSIAAALAILLCGALLFHVESMADARLAEEGEIVLDIFGLASADEFYADVGI